MDRVLPKIIGSGRVSGTRQSLDKKDRTTRKVLSWMETAARAGVLTSVTRINEEESNCTAMPLLKKKKTAKQYRLTSPKVKENLKITPSDKKMFKESFNTDKSRLEKRQSKYNLPPNCLLIVEDNIHSKDSGKSETGGKLMVYSRGNLKAQFLGEGIKYNEKDFYIHANTTDFTREIVKEIIGDEVESSREDVVEGREEEPKEKDNQKMSRPPTKYDLYLEASRKEREKATSSLDNSF